MTHMIGKFFLTSVLLATLAACGGDKSASAPAPTPPPSGTVPPPSSGPSTPSSIASQFGAAFASIFGASVNSEPKDPAPTDLAAVNTSAEPIDF